MAAVDVKQIIEAGVHFGHRVSRWHPKMRPYIFGKRNLIHIIDVRETVKGLVRASNFLGNLVALGKDVVFVGTKRQAKSLVMREAQRTGMHWVSERWLGGTLTNFHTVRSRLKRLEELEAMERDGSIEQYSKKRISALRRERRKIFRNLEGLRNMKDLPGCLIVIDVRNEHIAVREARKVGIPVVGLVDTDCDPRDVDIVIPGNDDAYKSILIVLRILAEAIMAGRDKYQATQAELAKAAQAEEEEHRSAGEESRPETQNGGGPLPSPPEPPGAQPERAPAPAAEAPKEGGAPVTGDPEEAPSRPAAAQGGESASSPPVEARPMSGAKESQPSSVNTTSTTS